METNEFIVNRFSVNTAASLPWEIPIGRFKDIPRLFHALGFTKGVEVGVFQGEYTRWLLRGIPGLNLTGVDVWESYGVYKDFENADLLAAYDIARANVAKWPNCKLIKGRSVDVASEFRDESLDFVFIDGNHAYEFVVQDLAAWTPKVRSGGIVYGHDFDDYTRSHRWSEMHVQQAVRGWIASYRIAPWYVLTRNRNKSWLYVKS